MEAIFLLSSTCVNCFVLCTGYLTINRCGYGINSLMKIYWKIAFYSLFLMFLSFIIFDTIIDFKYFFPLLTGKYWFCSTYFCMMIVAPFITKLTQTLSHKQYILLLIAMIGLTCWPFFGRLHGENMKPLYFITVYLIGGYFKLYGMPKCVINYTSLKLVLLTVLIAICCFLYDYYLIHEIKLHFFAYNNITLPLSVLLFVSFLKVKPGYVVNHITLIAPYTFAVYLIHCNNYVWPWLLPLFKEIPPSYCAVINIIYCIILFMIFSFMDFLVEMLFTSIKINNAIKVLSTKVEYYLK